MITGLTVHENLFGQSSTCTAFPPPTAFFCYHRPLHTSIIL